MCSVLVLIAAAHFCRSLLTLMKEHKPTHLVVCFDGHHETFRHQLFPDYKAGRTEKDASLIADLELIQQLLQLAGIGVVAPAGYEADDLIFTLAKAARDPRTLIYSGDRDLFQLASATTTILYPSTRARAILHLNAQDVQDMMQVRPEQIVDYKALRGDSTDNIPGIKGIGEKMAIDLLSRFDSIEDIYQNLGKITGRPYTLLRKGKAEAQLSKQLAALAADVPLPDDHSIDRFQVAQFNFQAIVPMLNELGMQAIAQDYQGYLNKSLLVSQL